MSVPHPSRLNNYQQRWLNVGTLYTHREIYLFLALIFIITFQKHCAVYIFTGSGWKNPLATFCTLWPNKDLKNYSDLCGFKVVLCPQDCVLSLRDSTLATPGSCQGHRGLHSSEEENPWKSFIHSDFLKWKSWPLKEKSLECSPEIVQNENNDQLWLGPGFAPRCKPGINCIFFFFKSQEERGLWTLAEF